MVRGCGLALLAIVCSPFLGACSSGDPGCPDCDDGVPCTVDSCIETQGVCQHIPDETSCQPDETCDASLGCLERTSCDTNGDCDDADVCTLDSCVAGQCRHELTCGCTQDSDCDDSDPCTVDTCQADTCQYQNTCECTQDGDCDDADPCTADTCVANHCQHQDTCACTQDEDCDDADPCTQDFCQAGQCIHTTTCACIQDGDCDDGNPCTDQTCNQGDCLYTDNTAVCNDGDACTAGDACGGGRCLAGTESCCGDQTDNDGDGQADCGDPDCNGDPACSGCQPVAEPEPVPMAPLPGEAVPGRSESTTVNGFDDDYIYDSTDDIKVGTRREWGGTIIFFGQDLNSQPGVNSTNTIDANDTGREVQVAFYDPDRRMQNCAWSASCASTPTECPNSITYLGWNPVQGGNRCNRGSGVESVDSQAGVLTVTTNPLFWNPNWDRQDCSDVACSDPGLRERRSDVRVIQRLRFVRKHVVELEYTVINLANLDHASTAQEMPTVYTANGNGNTPDLWRLFNSEGTEIAIDQPGNDGFFYKNFTSPGGWACMQNDDLTYGVGLFTENRLNGMQGWQNRGLPFNNFRPQFPFGIPPQGTVMARSYLLIGSQATIASEAAWLDTHLPPFGSLDEPVADQVVSGTITVRGWVLDNKGVNTVEAVVDGGFVVPLAAGGSRPDVCRVWPAYPNCPNVGYTGSLDTTGLTACQHLLEIRATDTDGMTRIIARRRFAVGP